MSTFKRIKQFGELCAVESVTAVSFFIMAGMCLHAGAIDGVVVSLLVMGGAVGLGLSRYRALTHNAGTAAPTSEPEAVAVKPKRNRAKPAKSAPRPKRAKVKRK